MVSQETFRRHRWPRCVGPLRFRRLVLWRLPAGIQVELGERVVREGGGWLLGRHCSITLYLNRLAFGFSAGWLRVVLWSPLRVDFVLPRVFRALVPRQRAEHHGDAFTDQLGREVGMTVGSHFLGELFDLLETKFLVCH